MISTLNPETIITRIFPEIQAIYRFRELVPMGQADAEIPL